MARRAEGNAAFLEANGYAGEPDALARFAAEHPESDYAAEASRSVAAVATRAKERFARAGLVLDVPDSIPGADRLRRVFTERAVQAYRQAGINLVPLTSASDPRAARLPAQVRIEHREQAVRTELEAGTVAQPGILARTTVRLGQTGSESPVWERSFEHRVAASEQRPGRSVLFGAGTGEFWADFFVPVASWDTRRARRDSRTFQEAPAAVEMLGSRVVVAFADGSFQVFDAADPLSPTLLAAYQRPPDLSKFDGVRAWQGHVAVYGPDGVERFRLGRKGPRLVEAHGRETVGSIAALERLDGGLVAASNRGLIWIGDDGGMLKLVDRPVHGVARMGERLLFTDGRSLFVSTLPVLRAGRIEGELRLGRGFRPGAVRVAGSQAVVVGERGTVRVDVRRPSRPQLASRIEMGESGTIVDAAQLGGRLFLLGERGLLVSDRRGERLLDSVDVRARERMHASGRHLVLVGEKSLQIVDATPFLREAPASVSR
jgi:hypothetical protein